MEREWGKGTEVEGVTHLRIGLKPNSNGTQILL